MADRMGFEPMKFGLGGRLSILAEISVYGVADKTGFEPVAPKGSRSQGERIQPSFATYPYGARSRI